MSLQFDTKSVVCTGRASVGVFSILRTSVLNADLKIQVSFLWHPKWGASILNFPYSLSDEEFAEACRIVSATL